MKPVGSTKQKIVKDNNFENAPRLENIEKVSVQ